MDGKLGFQIKGKKRPLVLESNQNEDGHFSRGEDSIDAIKEKPLLVIPVSNGMNRQKVDIKEEKAKSIEEVAALEVIRDLTRTQVKDLSGELVIGNSQSTNKALPILQASLAPELAGIEDENERFKVDMSLRADDVSFKSNIYKAVPIDEFGAAMLRGMGWSGPSKDDEEMSKKLAEPLFARDIHLGLGAKAKPILDAKGGFNKGKAAASKNEWLQKAESKLAAQALQEGSIVWLREAQYAGQRGVVTAVRGVPGMSKIRIVLEESGSEVIVKKTDAVPLSTGELAERPFRHPAGIGAIGSGTSDEGFTVLESKKVTELPTPSVVPMPPPPTTKEPAAQVQVDRIEAKAERGALLSATISAPSKQSSSSALTSSATISRSAANPASSSTSSACPMWLRPGLRVKLVTDKFGKQLYLKKGVLLDVYGDKVASVRLDSGALLETVKQRHLETVIPSERGACIVLTGRYRGLEAVLLERRRGQGGSGGGGGDTVVVQMAEDMSVVLELPLDDVCAFEENIFYQR